MADYLESNGETPLPWAWPLCQACMDLPRGIFTRWPLGELWEPQAWLLEVMTLTWQTWHFCQRTQAAGYKWTVADINFDTWLNEGRPLRQPLSDYERWRRAQEG